MTRITKPGDFQLIKYTTGNLARRFDLNTDEIKTTFQLNVDPMGFPKSFWLQKPYWASAQNYWSGTPYRSTTRYFRNQKWSIFRVLHPEEPMETDGAFMGEMHAQGHWETVDRYLVHRLDFTFLRAYRDELKEPFRRAAMLSKLKSQR